MLHLFPRILLVIAAVILPVASVPASGVAVLELFTSEGCSSCPPADRVLSLIIAKGDPGVMAVSWHVDYWNRLGWIDPYSRKEISSRQEDVCRSLQSPQLYTPQAVVNG